MASVLREFAAGLCWQNSFCPLQFALVTYKYCLKWLWWLALKDKRQSHLCFFASRFYWVVWLLHFIVFYCSLCNFIVFLSYWLNAKPLGQHSEVGLDWSIRINLPLLFVDFEEKEQVFFSHCVLVQAQNRKRMRRSTYNLSRLTCCWIWDAIIDI